MSSQEDIDKIAKEIAKQRNLPYTLKIERKDGNKFYCRSSWGNHMVYIKKKDKFLLESEE